MPTKRVLTTLTRNAVKFARQGGSVSVGAQGVREHIYFYVEDDGPGIPETDLARLGRPFEQASKAMANGMKGSGLGLAIARSYAELHGGSLNISSRFGEGTVEYRVGPVRHGWVDGGVPRVSGARRRGAANPRSGGHR